MIETSKLSFSYAETKILDSIDVNLKKDHFYSIIGPNGGGKTTFLRLLMGLLEPTKGSISIDGKSPFQMRKSIGYVPQSRNFDPEFPLTVLEIVLMGLLSELSTFGSYTAKQKKKATEILDLVGLAHMVDHPFGKLSGGEAQRALIARALVSEPKILLLDEPTANVDPAAEQSLYELIRNLKGSALILMVTHDLPGMIADSDGVLCIQKSLKEMDPAKVCGHFAMGLYHQGEK